MKKSNSVILILFFFVLFVVVAYIAFGKSFKEPISNKTVGPKNPPVSSEIPLNNLVGPRWTWEKTVLSEDEVVFPRVQDAFGITFGEDGTLNGTTDCNNFSGQYTKGEMNLEFGLFASTKMYCENSLEEIFKDSLTEVNEFSFDEKGKLILKSPSASLVFVDKDSKQNRNNWNLIKQAVANCNIVEGGQTHARLVQVKLKNGNKLEAYSPQIDNIFDIVNDAKEGCGEVMLWTE